MEDMDDREGIPMSLLSALFVCATYGECKNALLNASKYDAEALFLYRIWDEIPEQKKFASTYIAILTQKNVNVEIKTPYDRYLLAVFFESKGMRGEAANEYFKICREARGLLGAETCFRAYRLGIKDAKQVMKKRFENNYYLYFVD